MREHVGLDSKRVRDLALISNMVHANALRVQ